MSTILPPDQLEELLPLLPHLAEFVRGNTSYDPGDLTILLVGVGLETQPWALQEITTWLRILSYVKDPGNVKAGAFESAQRSLMLRGIPEIQALLAIRAVTGPTTASQLRLSVQQLDFGELKPGEKASQAFEVEGGPGRVVVQSDKVQVHPEQFGDGKTVVQVKVAPVEGGMLYTDLRIINSTGELRLPVVAQWFEEKLPINTEWETDVVQSSYRVDSDFAKEEKISQAHYVHSNNLEANLQSKSRAAEGNSASEEISQQLHPNSDFPRRASLGIVYKGEHGKTHLSTPYTLAVSRLTDWFNYYGDSEFKFPLSEIIYSFNQRLPEQYQEKIVAQGTFLSQLGGARNLDLDKILSKLEDLLNPPASSHEFVDLYKRAIQGQTLNSNEEERLKMHLDIMNYQQKRKGTFFTDLLMAYPDSFLIPVIPQGVHFNLIIAQIMFISLALPEDIISLIRLRMHIETSSDEERGQLLSTWQQKRQMIFKSILWAFDVQIDAYHDKFKYDEISLGKKIRSRMNKKVKAFNERRVSLSLFDLNRSALLDVLEKIGVIDNNLEKILYRLNHTHSVILRKSLLAAPDQKFFATLSLDCNGLSKETISMAKWFILDRLLVESHLMRHPKGEAKPAFQTLWHNLDFGYLGIELMYRRSLLENNS